MAENDMTCEFHVPTFGAYASGFEIYPQGGPAFEHLKNILNDLRRVDFTFQIKDPSANQGQMVSNFDKQLEEALLAGGASALNLQLPPYIPQRFDFAFTYEGRKVAVEIEKTNKEKILRDILKCHMYLHSGADFAVVGLPKNYPHKHKVWNLFDFGVDRLSECESYGFGRPSKLGRILLLGFTQYETSTDRLLCIATRQEMRREASLIPTSGHRRK